MRQSVNGLVAAVFTAESLTLRACARKCGPTGSMFRGVAEVKDPMALKSFSPDQLCGKTGSGSAIWLAAIFEVNVFGDLLLYNKSNEQFFFNGALPSVFHSRLGMLTLLTGVALSWSNGPPLYTL